MVQTNRIPSYIAYSAYPYKSIASFISSAKLPDSSYEEVLIMKTLGLAALNHENGC